MRTPDTSRWRQFIAPAVTRAVSVASVLALLALAVAACGGGAPSRTGASTARCPASAGLPANVSDHGAIVAPGAHISIQVSDFFFSPTCITSVPRGDVTLTLHNAGQALHNISIPELSIDADVSAGQTITIQVRIGSTPLLFFCKYHKSVGMYGALLPSSAPA